MSEHVAPFRMRPPRAGDLGWVIARHGLLYEQEYGWNIEFEVLVARVATDFFAGHDPVKELRVPRIGSRRDRHALEPVDLLGHAAQ